MNSTITITRKKNFFGLLRSYKIKLNGVECEKIKTGKSLILDKEPGLYELELEIDGIKSAPYKFDLKENEKREIVVSNSRLSDWVNVFVMLTMIAVIIIDVVLKENKFGDFFIVFILFLPLIQILLYKTVWKDKFFQFEEKKA